MLVKLIERSVLGNTTPTHRSRPNEIDNAEMQSQVDSSSLRPGLQHGHFNDYVVVSLAVWKQLLSLYGGGPVLARHVAQVCTPKFGLSTLSLPVDQVTLGVPVQPLYERLSSPRKTFEILVDPYPIVLNGYWCNRLGKPEPMKDEMIVTSQSTITSTCT